MQKCSMNVKTNSKEILSLELYVRSTTYPKLAAKSQEIILILAIKVFASHV